MSKVNAAQVTPGSEWPVPDGATVVRAEGDGLVSLNVWWVEGDEQPEAEPLKRGTRTR